MLDAWSAGADAMRPGWVKVAVSHVRAFASEYLRPLRLFGPLRGDSVLPASDWLQCAPCKGGAFQRVQGPPGKGSSRKQPEQAWR